MIRLLPHESETIVVAHGWDIVQQKLSDGLQRSSPPPGLPLLMGWVDDDRFHVRLQSRRHKSFTPVVIGRIEPVSSGCLVFLDYRLLPATRMYLIIWSLFLALAGVLLSYQYKIAWFGVGFLAVIAIVHFIAWANFKIHLKTTRQILMRILE